MKSDSIVLIGMAGVGKSTIGAPLAEALGFDFIDLDDYIREKEGKKIQQIIDEKGEETFLQLEKQSMREIDLHRRVVAPGGSIIYHPDLMESLKQNATLVYLNDSLENIRARLRDELARGIVGLKNKPLREIHEERKPLYARYADITISCGSKSSQQKVKEILQRFRDFTN